MSNEGVNYTPRAQQVLNLARKEAIRFNHDFIGTEHLLLGITSLGQGVAVNVLYKMGCDLEKIREELEKQIAPGPAQEFKGPGMPYTPRAKKALALAERRQKAMQHSYLGTEHLLLGLLEEGDGVAARVLKKMGVEIERTKQEILRELDPLGLLYQNTSAEETRGELKKLATLSDAVPTPEALRSFTRLAQELLRRAFDEAICLDHQAVDPEHLLLTMLRLDEGRAETRAQQAKSIATNPLLRVLAALGADVVTVRRKLRDAMGAGPTQDTPGRLVYSARFKKVLVVAAQEAKSLNHTYVGTEHLLLAILKDQDAITARVFKELGLDLQSFRDELLKGIEPNR